MQCISRFSTFFAILGDKSAVTRHPQTLENREVVGAAGFEPTTPCPPDKCATGLRYAPTVELFFCLHRVCDVVQFIESIEDCVPSTFVDVGELFG